MTPRVRLILACVALLSVGAGPATSAPATQAPAKPSADPAPLTPLSEPTTDQAAPWKQLSRANRARRAFLADQRAAIAEIRGDASPTPTHRADEFVTLAFAADGQLLATLTREGARQLAAGQATAAQGGGWISIDSIGDDAPQPQLPADVPTTFRMRYVRFDEAALRSISVELLATSTSIGLSVTIQRPRDETTTSQLNERAADPENMDDVPTASITLQHLVEADPHDDSAGETNARNAAIEAESTLQLFTDAHADSLAILGEGLLQLRAMPLLAGGLSDDAIRQVCFADPETGTALPPTLRRLLADVEQRGDASVHDAFATLRDADPSLTMSLAHASRAGWSPEVCLNVDAVLAMLLPLSDPDAQRIRRSPDRLIDLLYSPSDSVRHAALARLEHLAKRKLPIDVAGDPYAMSDQLEALRLFFEPEPPPIVVPLAKSN